MRFRYSLGLWVEMMLVQPMRRKWSAMATAKAAPSSGSVAEPSSSSKTSEGTVSPTSVTFTPANWNGLRTVTELELKQRVRSRRWITALVVWFVVIGAITSLVILATSQMIGGEGTWCQREGVIWA